MPYALLRDGLVAEIIADATAPLNDRYHPDFVASLVECSSDVQQGWLFDGKEFSAAVDKVLSLDDIKSSLKAGVDDAAETDRLKYITPGTGQAMTYQQKVSEAQTFKAATSPQASDYPILSSEVGITAETLDEVADVVLAAFAQWQQIGAMIEAIRLGAKRDIEAAQDEVAARNVVSAILWPSAQQGTANNE